jgi:hypothetical protein
MNQADSSSGSLQLQQPGIRAANAQIKGDLIKRRKVDSTYQSDLMKFNEFLEFRMKLRNTRRLMELSYMQ